MSHEKNGASKELEVTSEMNNLRRKEDFKVKCKNCNFIFSPVRVRFMELKRNKSVMYWLCPSCNKKNPNLIRHARRIALLFIIMIYISIISLTKTDIPSIAKPIHILLIALALTAVIAIYSNRKFWQSILVKSMVWIVVGPRIIFGVIGSFWTVPNISLFERFLMSIGVPILFSIYFIWVLHSAPKKYVVS